MTKIKAKKKAKKKVILKKKAITKKLKVKTNAKAKAKALLKKKPKRRKSRKKVKGKRKVPRQRAPHQLHPGRRDSNIRTIEKINLKMLPPNLRFIDLSIFGYRDIRHMDLKNRQSALYKATLYYGVINVYKKLSALHLVTITKNPTLSSIFLTDKNYIKKIFLK